MDQIPVDLILSEETVRASTPMRLITLTGWDLRRLRNRIPELEARISKLAAERGGE